MTKQGVRDVPYPAALYRELIRSERLVDSRRRSAGGGWSDFDPVLPSPDDTPPRASPLLDGRFRRLLKRAGLPQHFTPHSLRYTYPTLQLLAGERDKLADVTR